MKNIRKTKVLLPVMLAAVALSACENTPDNIRSNKHSAEVDSGEAYVSSENIYDSFDVFVLELCLIFHSFDLTIDLDIQCTLQLFHF